MSKEYGICLKPGMAEHPLKGSYYRQGSNQDRRLARLECQNIEREKSMEPIFTRPDLPRYSKRPFPAYRYLPFQKDPTRPHPLNDPAGHSFSRKRSICPASADAWQCCDLYLYAIDLFNQWLLVGSA